MLLEHFDPRGIFALPDQSSHVYVIFALEMPQAQRRPVDRPSVHAVETEFMTQSRGANAWLPFEILQRLSERPKAGQSRPSPAGMPESGRATFP